MTDTQRSKKDAPILVVDDEVEIVNILERALTNHDYECVKTTSPFEAVELLTSKNFSVLITDLRMPGMDGHELIKRARDIDPDIGVIVVTALSDASDAIQTMREGADDYVCKPFNIHEIIFSLERVLEKRKLIFENRRHQEELALRIREATQDVERVNRELRQTKEYLERLLQSTADTILTVTMDGKITFANKAVEKMFGYTPSALEGRQLATILAGGTSEFHYIERILEQGRILQNYQSEIIHSSDQRVPVSMTISVIEQDDSTKNNDEETSFLIICKDITEQKRLEQELKEMSVKDSLTDLYNQGFFYDCLATEIERSKRQGHPLSLLLLDVDQFKSYNDAHGHLEGDRVLKAVAEVMMESTRGHVDRGFRYGGDEFTLILPETDEDQAYEIAERIRKKFESKKFDHLTLSIGIMSYRMEYSLRSFIRFVDAAMYDAKRAGGNRVYIYQIEEGSRKKSNSKKGK